MNVMKTVHMAYLRQTCPEGFWILDVLEIIFRIIPRQFEVGGAGGNQVEVAEKTDAHGGGLEAVEKETLLLNFTHYELCCFFPILHRHESASVSPGHGGSSVQGCTY